MVTRRLSAEATYLLLFEYDGPAAAPQQVTDAFLADLVAQFLTEARSFLQKGRAAPPRAD